MPAEPALDGGVFAVDADEVAENFIAVVKAKTAGGFVFAIGADDGIEADAGDIVGTEDERAFGGGEGPGDALLGGDALERAVEGGAVEELEEAGRGCGLRGREEEQRDENLQRELTVHRWEGNGS
jgi:hypothetical protein